MTITELIKHDDSIITEINDTFLFKLNLASCGPGFHTEFKFSITSKVAICDVRTISLSIHNNIFLAINERSSYDFNEYEIDFLLKEPFGRGVQGFVEYMDKENISTSTDLEIEILEYYFHPVDSKPIANEVGIETAIKCVFGNQLKYEYSKFEILQKVQ